MVEVSSEFKKQIEEIVREVIAEFVRQNEQKAKEISLIERTIKIEEELKALREIELTRFEALQKDMNTRFEAIQKDMNTRFEVVYERFASLEKRLSFLQWFMIAGFAFLSILITFINLFVK